MTTINTGNVNIGLNGLTKRVANGGEQAKDAAKTAGTGGFSNDALVRTGGAAAAGTTASAAATAALDSLAAAYDADPAKFAYNLAEQALNNVASLVG